MSSTVFISYARHDASALAQRLHRDILTRGYGVWLDRARLHSGRSWTVEIEQALDRSDVVLALLSRGSFLSDTCRAEQLRSLRKGKCVIPLLVQRDADRPIHLESAHYLDFSNDTAYEDQLPKLLDDIERREGAALNGRFRQTYLTVPPLPPHYVERPMELEALRRAVMIDGVGSRIAITAVKGMAGIGKTVLAQALCFDEVAQAAFPDGIIWLSVGKEPRDLVPLFREAAKAIGDSLEGYDTLQGASNRLRNRLRDKAALLVLDDVWDPRDAAPFLMDAPRSRLLITTRDARTAVALGANQQELDVLTWEQSRQLLAQWARCDEAQLPAEASDIIRECGSLPLAVAMVGAQLRGRPDRWPNMLEKLRNADLDRIRQTFPEYPHPDLLRAIDVSMEALDSNLRARYLDFAVFPEDCAIPEAALRTLWRLPQYDVEDAVDRLIDLSLLTRDDERRLRLHDLLLDYLRRRVGGERLVERHNDTLRAYAEHCPEHWSRGPSDGYFFENLAWHLRSARRGDEALRLLCDFRWLDAKLRASGVVALLADYEWYAQRDADARMLQETIRLSGHVLAANANQLAGQLLGRLTPGTSRVVDAVRDQAAHFDGAPWLRPWRSLLTGPGGALLFTLAGHTGRVRALALTADGTRALSASDDHTVRVWDLRRGILERVLLGHHDVVRAVAVLHDGETAVSAADDHTLRVWRLSTGKQEACVDTQLDWIRGLAALSDNAHIASVSDDRTIKIWDLTRGGVERVLRGHAAEINALAALPDGRALVSAGVDRTVRLWDIAADGAVGVLRGHRARVTGVAVARDRIVSVSADGVARAWPTDGTGESRELGIKAEGVRHLALTPDGSAVIAGADDNNVYVWGLTDGVSRVLEGHSDWVNAVAATPDGRLAISGSDDGTLKVWDLGRVGTVTLMRDHGDRVRAVAVTPDERTALSTSDDHTLRVWDVATRSVRRVIRGHHHWVFACTPDGARVVSSGGEGSCYVWDLETDRELQRFRGHEDRVRCVAVAPCGTRVVSGGDDSTLRVWDIASGEEMLCIRLERQWPRAVAVTRDSRYALTAAESTVLKLWDLERGADLLTFRGHAARVNAVALSSDGRFAVSGSDDHTVRIWELASGRSIHVIEAHDARVNAVALLPGDGLALSASDDGDLRVWDVSKGAAVATFTGESPLLTCAAGCRTGVLVAGDRLGLVHFFTVEATH